MLGLSNLQFTNATCLNDPFDCHPGLFKYDSPQVFCVEDDDPVPSSELLAESVAKDMEGLRDSTWISSLSKNNNSLLMWTHYCNNHQGVCIGLNIKLVKSHLFAHLDSPYKGPQECEVNYGTIINKPNCLLSDKGYLDYQASTKAVEWEYEQEIRLVLLNSYARWVSANNSCQFRASDGRYLVRNPYRPTIDGSCFESVYLGVKTSPYNKNEVIKAARMLNPDIKIYQMNIDPEAFKLKEELIES